MIFFSRSLVFHRFVPYRVSIYHRKIGTMPSPTLSKLASPLKELVLGASPELGKSEKDKADVIEWIEKVIQGDIVKPEVIHVRRRLLSM